MSLFRIEKSALLRLAPARPYPFRRAGAIHFPQSQLEPFKFHPNTQRDRIIPATKSCRKRASTPLTPHGSGSEPQRVSV